MKVLLVKPHEYAVEANIKNDLKSEQKAVGGYIEILTPNRDPVAYVMNEEGKIMGLDLNRAIYDERGNITDIIAGTFFVCGIKEDSFTSLSPELMEKYKKQFLEPEVFTTINGKMKATKVRIPAEKSIAGMLKERTEQAAKDNTRPTLPKAKNKQER